MYVSFIAESNPSQADEQQYAIQSYQEDVVMEDAEAEEDEVAGELDGEGNVCALTVTHASNSVQKKNQIQRKTKTKMRTKMKMRPGWQRMA